MALEANKRRHRPSLRRQGALALALVAGGASTFAAAPPTNSTFRVTVTLNAPEAAPTAQCSSSIEPGTNKIIVACAEPKTPRDIPRYLLHVYRAGEWLAVDSQMATGTLTSWRIVHVANREYLEMMVGW